LIKNAASREKSQPTIALNECTRKIIDNFEGESREIMVRQKVSKKDFDIHYQMSRGLKFISSVKPLGKPFEL
jgi:hypothetical protein